MPSPWIDDTAPSGHPGLQDLPSRADVIVVGAGLAGAATVAFLAEAGVDVLLLEARDLPGAGASGRAPGHVLTGLVEPPYRVLHALGETKARALYGFSRQNQELLTDLGLLLPTGGWWVSTDDREPDQIEQSVQALEKLKVPVVLRRDANEALGATGLTGAMFLPEDGFVDPHACVRELVDRAIANGARCHVRCPVERIDFDDRGAVVRLAGRAIPSEVVVIASEARSDTVDPWFEHKVMPVREQALLTAPVRKLPHPGGRAGYGYTSWRQLEDGRLVGAGCRWATPHMEVGERDEHVVDAIQQRIAGFLERHLGAHAPIEARWSWIEGHSCDGLPIIGPLPGNPRMVACVGFGANAAGLAVRAARGVADGLLGTGAPLPSFLAASRFL